MASLPHIAPLALALASCTGSKIETDSRVTADSGPIENETAPSEIEDARECHTQAVARAQAGVISDVQMDELTAGISEQACGETWCINIQTTYQGTAFPDGDGSNPEDVGSHIYAYIVPEDPNNDNHFAQVASRSFNPEEEDARSGEAEFTTEHVNGAINSNRGDTVSLQLGVVDVDDEGCRFHITEGGAASLYNMNLVVSQDGTPRIELPE